MCAHARRGYPTFKGSVFDGAHLTALMDGLKANGLLQGTTHLLTGYIGGVSLLHDVATVVRTLREANGGELTYCELPIVSCGQYIVVMLIFHLLPDRKQ